ncbi:hypothetical protein BN133_2158 [Cronobacter dublinensis 582]|nr:hypothetical protein BN133_2158 [Cronobacter dublinensis 582]
MGNVAIQRLNLQMQAFSSLHGLAAQQLLFHRNALAVSLCG